ncbi:hypothetical protein ACTA71_008762 [Dictyostelium dimigraforme]
MFFTEFEKVSIKMEIPTSLDYDNTINNIKSALNETVDINQQPNTLSFRYIMVIDPSENESSLQILNEIKLEIMPVLIRVGGFEQDTTEEKLVKCVNKIKASMAKGDTVILVNSEKIDSCFYEVFDRYYTILHSNDSKDSRDFLSNISFGTHSIYCKVHPNFKIIIHMPLSRLKCTQLPWLNRFEKYQLSIDLLTKEIVNKNDSKLAHFKKISLCADHFISTLHLTGSNGSLLTGFSNETKSLVVYKFFKSLEYFESDVDESETQRFGFYKSNQALEDQTKINFKLLQIARPECFIKNVDSFPTKYIEEYLLNQEHFSIIRFLRNLFESKYQHKETVPNKWTIFTRSSLALSSLKDSEINKILSKSLSDNIISSQSIKVLQLSFIRSSIDCENVVNSFHESDEELVLIVVADMVTCNQNQVTYIFELLSRLNKNKFLITIYHYPAEYSISNQIKLNSIFLCDMEFIYIDSLGISFEKSINNSQFSVEGDIRDLISSTCGITSKANKKPIEDIVKGIFLDQLKVISHELEAQIPFNYRRFVHPFYKENTNNFRFETLKTLFNNNYEWYESFIVNFTSHWLENNLFDKILSNIANLIICGKESHPILETIKSSMVNYVYPTISNMVKIITNYYAIDQIIEIDKKVNDQNETNQEELALFKSKKDLVKELMESSKLPYFSEIQIDRRLEPIKLKLSKLPKQSSIPLYDHFDTQFSSLINNVINQSKVKSKKFIYSSMKTIMNDHPLEGYIKIISNSDQLFKMFQNDFIVRSLGIKEELVDLFVSILDKLLPFEISNKDNFNKIIQYWIIKHFKSNILLFLREHYKSNFKFTK